jgi:hypothetical protein
MLFHPPLSKMEKIENNKKFLVELDQVYDVSKLDHVHIEDIG